MHFRFKPRRNPGSQSQHRSVNRTAVTPFYDYAYAFGVCLVNSLYDVYRTGHPDFTAKYRDMLRAGGTLRHKELLAPFGLDAGDPAFWKRGLGVVSGLIDELEAM